jgi:formyltetrahydrofolate deformylase
MERAFAVLAEGLSATWKIHYRGVPLRMGILVSRHDHCLLDVLYRWQSGELDVAPDCVVSNHPDLAPLAERHGIPFHHIPTSRETRAGAEREILARVVDTDFLVLARYMQILSGDFLEAYGRDVINIHHSFLPSFRGADPYRQARERGVKIIGATAHFVTEDLDEGPIIEQMVERVSHRDDVETLRRKGRILEQQALANALHAHAEHRVIRYKNQTIVFN